MLEQCCNPSKQCRKNVATLRCAKKSSLRIVQCNITLGGEGNENGEKTTVGLISKKVTLHLEHTFFVRFFAVVLHHYNVKLPSYTFYTGNVVRLHVHFFFHCCSFSPWWPLVFLTFSPPLQNFRVILPTKNVSFVFLSLALALCRSFSR